MNQVPAPTGTTFAQDVRLLIPSSAERGWRNLSTRALRHAPPERSSTASRPTDLTPACSRDAQLGVHQGHPLCPDAGQSPRAPRPRARTADSQIVTSAMDRPSRSSAAAQTPVTSVVASYTYGLKVGNLGVPATSPAMQHRAFRRTRRPRKRTSRPLRTVSTAAGTTRPTRTGSNTALTSL